MGVDRLIAHSANATGERHPLLTHLRAVAQLAAGFAEPLGAAELAHAAGLWHDLGKASPAFQRYLQLAEVGDSAAITGSVDHKGAGAVVAAEHGIELLSMLIQGHHGGLCDRARAADWLREKRADPDVGRLLGELPTDLQELLEVTPASPEITDRLEAELFGRLLFSCLVDADGLDTEAHFRAQTAAARSAQTSTMAELWDRFIVAYPAFVRQAPDTAVNRARAAIWRHCYEASSEPPGLFRMAVPTGGGKTLAGLGFALRHAVHHRLRRVIVAVPYTSITEQTADVYREILGAEAVLEHHSALDADRLAQEPPLVQLRARLAAENWDAPVVVTTTVRLFESLLSNGVMDTRRLHRLARSVIVIDEAQAIPATVMEPALDVLRGLCGRYGASVVLSTATQPAAPEGRLRWLSEARDVVPEPGRYFAALRRVEWVAPAAPWSLSDVAREVSQADQAMAIMNRRRDALEVLDGCPPGTLHLSTLLCAVHRRQVLAEVRRRLDAGEPCRLVTTQVVEAGVDLDFPLVLRALAPWDSIVQAGGRCNREGRLARGRVVVFDAGGLPPDRAYRVGTMTTRALLASGAQDFDDPELAARYFRGLYRNINTDEHRVQEARRRLAYEQTADRFRMIDDAGSPVVIPFNAEATRLASQLNAGSDPGAARRLWRALQPYLVSLRQRQLDRALEAGWLQGTTIPVWSGPYDSVRGVAAAL